jgi:hypothetical protein
MSTTQQRLDDLLAERATLRAAQTSALSRGSSVQHGDRRWQSADLQAINARLKEIDREIAALQARLVGAGSLRYKKAVFS